MYDLKNDIKIMRYAVNISRGTALEIQAFYDEVRKSIDTSLSFHENRKIIDALYRDFNLLASMQTAMIPVAEFTIITAIVSIPALKPIKVTKRLINDSFNNVIGESNITLNQSIAKSKFLSKQTLINNTKQAIDNGWSSKQLADALTVSKEQTIRHTNTIARTSVNAVSNETKAQLYKANNDIVDRVLLSASLDSKTSNICKLLDGKVFKLDKSPKLPLHYNERSQLVPILKNEDSQEVQDRLLPRPEVVPKNEEIYKEKKLKNKNGKTRNPLRSDKSPLKGSTTNALNYEEWIRQQPTYYQNDILGKEGAKKLMNGASLNDAIKTSPLTESLLDDALN
jgi:SPP1 gp7 family putative phage head morphogenesis protein